MKEMSRSKKVKACLLSVLEVSTAGCIGFTFGRYFPIKSVPTERKTMCLCGHETCFHSSSWLFGSYCHVCLCAHFEAK